MATRVMTDIPELVGQLKGQRAREKDYIVMQGELRLDPAVGEMRLQNTGSQDDWQVMDQAHQQIANKLDIPWRYYKRLLETERSLLGINVNRWFDHDSKAMETKRLVRTVDDKVRAFLSDKYRPISHLDLVTTAVQVITGQDAEGNEKPWARGARCFSWFLNPMKLDVEFVNPGIMVDLNQPDTSFIAKSDMEPDLSDGLAGWFKKKNEGGQHWVFPTARIRNSETGHGGLYVDVGILEGVCLNGLHFTRNLAQVHVGGKLLQEHLWSPDTLKKMNQVIFAKVQDVVREAFNPDRFLVQCKRFKGLEASQINHREAVDAIVHLNGLSDGIRNEILACYAGTTQRRDNLFDVTRAVTAAAHSVRTEDPEQASKLEDLGGQLVERGLKALVAA